MHYEILLSRKFFNIFCFLLFNFKVICVDNQYISLVLVEYIFFNYENLIIDTIYYDNLFYFNLPIKQRFNINNT